MSIFSIHHITRYEYNRPVKESLNQIKIYPLTTASQEIIQHEVVITGYPDIHLFPDYWGNLTGVFTVSEPHKELVINSRLKIRVLEKNLPFLNLEYKEDPVFPERDLILAELRQPEMIANQQEINRIITEIYSESKNTAQLIQESNEYIYKNFQYIKGITDYETTVDEILNHKSGVCQDFAHVLLQLLRTMGIPSRYVSGYICPNKNGMRGEGATHAWVQAWIPGYGWAGIDPTNNIWVNNNHVKLAVGRNFNDCTPVKGTFKGLAKQNLSVYVSVGYEDGQVFEELNKVTLEAEQNFTTEDEEPEIIPGQEHQQQQQQQ
jgi:transglutaminase-like putative cysteine protease